MRLFVGGGRRRRSFPSSPFSSFAPTITTTTTTTTTTNVCGIAIGGQRCYANSALQSVVHTFFPRNSVANGALACCRRTAAGGDEPCTFYAIAECVPVMLARSLACSLVCLTFQQYSVLSFVFETRVCLYSIVCAASAAQKARTHTHAHTHRHSIE